jgi:hypothetical protein
LPRFSFVFLKEKGIRKMFYEQLAMDNTTGMWELIDSGYYRTEEGAEKAFQDARRNWRQFHPNSTRFAIAEGADI